MEAHVAMTGADEGVILSYRLQLSLDSPRRGRRPLGLLTHVVARSLSLDSQAMTALSNAHLAETPKMVWKYDAALLCPAWDAIHAHAAPCHPKGARPWTWETQSAGCFR